jgi:hypothetical protein
MPVVPAVAVEHEHGWSRGRELRDLVMSTLGLEMFVTSVPPRPMATPRPTRLASRPCSALSAVAVGTP